MDLKERDALGDSADSHWYYVSKASMVARLLPTPPRNILDVGAGLGWFSRWFLTHGYGTHATCVDPGYESESEEDLGDGRRMSFVRSIDRTEADLVLLMDVLEHVDDDVALLREYWEKAPPGAVFVITVPAFEFLWSSHDDYLEHRRRYTRTRLANTIRAAGAEPRLLHYYFGAIFPVAGAVRLLKRKSKERNSDMRPVPAPLNALLTVVCKLEARLTRWNRLAGLTVVAQFTKPDVRPALHSSIRTQVPVDHAGS
ncbi:class I SAM-dependent methyltransferase [Cereibacter sphaeroides]|uniref:class I SAM-dependent methyltransferase n=1 Tax=Cereibacter sphaeroides TaxID=1063 RepID=UPI001F274F94|nr:class I SAM-dependent methyltransferase [Cereibacter sphaeroides]MCE6957687.1 class I SAM-dependent methyltransferase [Cereibacter sphaeroides]MCE6967005.1 class I SAM-dependent methyltransferase [Cereibacter sphaeroides]MCE6971452.1 class I SAM-dependent methyltransferase [Cereibacter sphaeroides]